MIFFKLIVIWKLLTVLIENTGTKFNYRDKYNDGGFYLLW